MSADKKLIAGGNRDRPLDLRLMALGQQERGDAGKINTRLKLPILDREPFNGDWVSLPEDGGPVAEVREVSPEARGSRP